MLFLEPTQLQLVAAVHKAPLVQTRYFQASLQLAAVMDTLLFFPQDPLAQAVVLVVGLEITELITQILAELVHLDRVIVVATLGEHMLSHMAVLVAEVRGVKE